MVRRVEIRGNECERRVVPSPPASSIACLRRVRRSVLSRKEDASDLQSGRVSGTVVAFDPIDLPVHDVLERVHSGRRQVRVPLTVTRVPVFFQSRRDHESELVPCSDTANIKGREREAGNRLVIWCRGEQRMSWE